MKQTKILNAFFLETPKRLPFFKRTPLVDHKHLNNIIPHTYDNLLAAVPAFLSGLNDLDEQFLHGTLSPYLNNRISRQIKHLSSQEKNDREEGSKYGNLNQLNLNFDELDFDGKDRFSLSIAPYTVFKATVGQRINQHPLKNTISLTRNRYLMRSSQTKQKSIFQGFSEIVYGFRCEYRGPQKKLAITFEGDIEKQQFFIVDIQNVLFSEQISHDDDQVDDD